MYVDSSAQDDEAEGGQTMRGVVGGTKLFGRFTLQKVLGRGGMGVVWLARDERLDRLVALKLIPEAVIFDASAQEDLKRETRKSLLLTHPNIVRIFDFIEDERSAGISMEYVDGATLSYLRVQKAAKCFEVDELRPWLSSLCDALGYAHSSAQLVHRDLKPANLMVNSKSELKVTDFGIACTLRDSMSYVSVRTSSGTLNYMSPQQMLGEDPASSDDIYALGATLYELLSSKPPFHGGDVASQVREVTAPLIAHRRSKFQIVGQPIPKYWEETIAACLAKDPARRPQTAAEVARRLRIGGTIRMAPRPEPVRLVRPIHLAAMAGGALAIILAIFFLHKPRIDKPTLATDAKPLPPIGYAIETTKAKPTAAAASEPAPVEAPPAAEPPREVSSAKIGSLEVTTSPAGADFSIYAGVVASKSAPVSGALRSGSSPGTADDLPTGRYTVFFHKDGWPDDRTEVSLDAGETLPLNYSFPQGSVTVTSSPDGAEVFLGTTSLGKTPLTVEVPAGKQQLIARFSDRPDRTQSVLVEEGKTSTLAFQLRSHSSSSSSRARATPPPSLIGKVGESLKHVFSGGATPPPRRRR